MNNIFYYSRRPIAEGASGIGSWVNIMEFLAMLSIPTNFAAIYFSDGGGLGDKGESPVVIWLRSNNIFWNKGNIILLIVGVEHLLFIIKIVMAVAIPDVPAKVLAEEAKRVQIQKQAEEWMNAEKELAKGQSIEERVRKEREANGTKANDGSSAQDRAAKAMITELD